ncbi:hypothetical protein MFIFM68171_09859 [Madurella fahalii]|uniref:Uncharacterized protein n=1 Tax=Madurella fahalii TaxID=1157608 RepID=A0ABQ0GPI3_9PEZI
MAFPGPRLINAIASLLFDFVRAFLPSWFPKVHPAEQDFGRVQGELNALHKETQEVRTELVATKNVLRVPEPVAQESLAEILISVRNELKTLRGDTREQNELLRHLETELHATREDVARKLEPMNATLLKMQDALSRLSEPVSAFPKVQG